MMAGLMARAADKSSTGLEPPGEGKQYKSNTEMCLTLAFSIHSLPLVTLRSDREHILPQITIHGFGDIMSENEHIISF